jgi:hypothetical protein
VDLANIFWSFSIGRQNAADYVDAFFGLPTGGAIFRQKVANLLLPKESTEIIQDHLFDLVLHRDTMKTPNAKNIFIL